MTLSEVVSKVEGVGKTFLGWVVKEYKQFYQKEPEIEQVVDTVVDYAEPALVILLDACGGAAVAPEVEAIISEAQSDLKVVGALVYDFGATPTAASIAAAVQKNLQSLEGAGHIKDDVFTAKLQLIIKAVGALAIAIANQVQSATASKAA